MVVPTDKGAKQNSTFSAKLARLNKWKVNLPLLSCSLLSMSTKV